MTDTDNWVGCWCWPLIAEERGHESCLLRGPSSPGPERSRCPRIGLSWPAEEGHLSPPLLSWQSCVSLPTGLGLPRGRARMLPGDPVTVCVPYRMGGGRAALRGLIDLMIPQRREQRRLSTKGPDD